MESKPVSVCICADAMYPIISDLLLLFFHQFVGKYKQICDKSIHKYIMKTIY